MSSLVAIASSAAHVASDTVKYQIGDKWERLVVESEYEIPSNLRYLSDVLKGSAKVGGGSGIYIGEFAGEHLVITNAHVCELSYACHAGLMIEFPLLKSWPKVKKFLGVWHEIDLAIFSIEIPNYKRSEFASLSVELDFLSPLKARDQLITFGFGSAGNGARSLSVSSDYDCKIASSAARLIADPDNENPLDYRVWSVAHGCDISNGDSGSVVVTAKSGKVIALNWTGKVPKSKAAQSSEHLWDQVGRGNSALIWGELSYAIPMSKILEKFKKVALDQKESQELRNIISAIIDL